MPQAIQPDYHRNIVHIAEGIELLQSGKGIEAYNHLVNTRDSVDWKVSIGRSYPIKRLLSEEDVVCSASLVAAQSNGGDKNYHAEIGGWFLNNSYTNFSDFPELFTEEYVDMFHMEVGTVAAEEWLHMWQFAQNAPLAGQSDREVDVAAYLDLQGIQLSYDFLTRYPARAKWFCGVYPDRTTEVVDFGNKYGRYILHLT